MTERTVELQRRSDGVVVDAALHVGLRPVDLVLVERSWGPERLRILHELLSAGVTRAKWPGSLHWDWTGKAPELRLLQSTGYAVVCEGSWQGVMMTGTAMHYAELESDRGKPLVYVDYLEAAPWNWPVAAITQLGTFRGIGSVLFREAVAQSVTEGFGGRVGLHALPQAEGFYGDACGMSRLGKDPNKDNLVYYEFSVAQAEGFLSGG